MYTLLTLAYAVIMAFIVGGFLGYIHWAGKTREYLVDYATVSAVLAAHKRYLDEHDMEVPEEYIEEELDEMEDLLSGKHP